MSVGSASLPIGILPLEALINFAPASPPSTAEYNQIVKIHFSKSSPLILSPQITLTWTNGIESNIWPVSSPSPHKTYHRMFTGAIDRFGRYASDASPARDIDDRTLAQ